MKDLRSILKQVIEHPELSFDRPFLLCSDKIFAIRGYVLQRLYWDVQAGEFFTELMQKRNCLGSFITALENLLKREVNPKFEALIPQISKILDRYDITLKLWSMHKEAVSGIITVKYIGKSYDIIDFDHIRETNWVFISLASDKCSLQLPEKFVATILDSWPRIKMRVLKEEIS